MLTKYSGVILAILHDCVNMQNALYCYKIKGGENMGGKTSAASHNKYIAKAYDRINLTVPKGQKETIQAHAAASGESVNGFINRAIGETMERDSSKVDGQSVPKSEAGKVAE